MSQFTFPSLKNASQGVILSSLREEKVCLRQNLGTQQVKGMAWQPREPTTDPADRRFGDNMAFPARRGL